MNKKRKIIAISVVIILLTICILVSYVGKIIVFVNELPSYIVFLYYIVCNLLIVFIVMIPDLKETDDKKSTLILYSILLIVNLLIGIGALLI